MVAADLYTPRLSPVAETSINIDENRHAALIAVAFRLLAHFRPRPPTGRSPRSMQDTLVTRRGIKLAVMNYTPPEKPSTEEIVLLEQIAEDEFVQQHQRT